MKSWKTVLVTAVIVLLVVALVIVSQRGLVSQADRTIKDRIEQYKLVLEEQQLVTEILTLRYDAAVIQAKFQPTPEPAPNE